MATRNEYTTRRIKIGKSVSGCKSKYKKGNYLYYKSEEGLIKVRVTNVIDMGGGFFYYSIKAKNLQRSHILERDLFKINKLTKVLYGD